MTLLSKFSSFLAVTISCRAWSDLASPAAAQVKVIFQLGAVPNVGQAYLVATRYQVGPLLDDLLDARQVKLLHQERPVRPF